MRPLARPLSVAFVGLAVGCATSEVPDPLAPASAAASDQAIEGVRVGVEWMGNGRARYVPSTLSAKRALVRIEVENQRPTRLDTSALRLRLVVVRDGVRFPCDEEMGPAPRAPEVTAIGPGQRASYERSIDCPLPLVGEYRVMVAVAFGHEGAWARGQAVREMTLRVSAPRDAEPRAVEAANGLWASLGASGLMAAARNDAKGKIAVALVNAGTETLDVPPIRLAMRVYRERNPIPCEDEPVALTPPPRLLPGRSWSEPVAVSCLALSTPGHYELVGRLKVSRADGETEQTIGRLHVEVSDDPARLHPLR